MKNSKNKSSKKDDRLISVLQFPFGKASVYKGHTVMNYYYDPVPIDLQYAFIHKRNRKSSSVADSQPLFRYLDSVILKRRSDFTIVGIAKNRVGSELEVTIRTSAGPLVKLETVRLSIDRLNQLRVSMDMERISPVMPEDFMEFADIDFL